MEELIFVFCSRYARKIMRKPERKEKKQVVKPFVPFQASVRSLSLT